MKRPLQLCLLALLLAGAVGARGEESLWFGVLRDDGIVAPVALFTDGSWSRPWPDDSSTARAEMEPEGKFAGAVPLARIPPEWLGNRPAPSRWTLLSPRGETNVTEVDRAVEYESHCGYLWGFTNRPLPDPEVKRDAGPVEKRGFVASLPVLSLPFSEIEGESREVAGVMAALGRRLRQLEASAIDAAAKGSLHEAFPRSRTARDRVPVKPLHAYKSVQADGSARWYLELEKEYPKSATASDGGCPVAVVIQAWAISRKGRTALLNAATVLTDCDLQEVHSFRPAVLIPLQHGTYVLGLGHAYESENYDIFQWLGREVLPVVSYGGGGC